MEVSVLVWSNPDFDEMPNAIRAAWVRELYPALNVVVADDGPANESPGPVHWAYVSDLLARLRLTPDVVVSSEGYGRPFAEHLGAEHVAADPDRRGVPTSGTAIRADVHADRRDLDTRVYRHFVERVVFLGAESTGKSTLAARMAAGAQDDVRCRVRPSALRGAGWAAGSRRLRRDRPSPP